MVGRGEIAEGFGEFARLNDHIVAAAGNVMQNGAERRFAQRGTARQIDKRVLKARRGFTKRRAGQGAQGVCTGTLF